MNGAAWIHGYGSNNIFFGLNAGNFSLTGTGEVGIGSGALQALSSGSSNTGVGFGALFSTASSANSTAVGYSALQNSTGADNTAVGYIAGSAIVAGTQNTFLGSGSNASGDYSNATAIGYGSTATGSNTIQLGNSSVTAVNTYGALRSGVASSTTGALVLANSASANLTTIKAGNATGAVTYILPTSDGSVNQVLQTDGGVSTATLSWTTPSAGGGLSSYGFAYDAEPIGQFVPGGADFNLSNNGLLSGITHTAFTSTITVSTTGTYEVNFTVNTNAGSGAAVAIAVNGTVDPSTVIPVQTNNSEVYGTSLLNLTAGDVLTLRNNSGTPIIAAGLPYTGASIVVKLIH